MGRRSNGEGSIRKRTDGRYEGVIRLDGKRHSVYGKTRKEASDKLKQLQVRQREGADLSSGKYTVSQLLERWYSASVLKRNKFRTATSHRQIIDNHLIPAFGSIDLVKLRPEPIQDYLDQLSAKGLAPRTLRNIKATLRKALAQALRWRLIGYNPATLVETPKPERVVITPLSAAEARTFLLAVTGDPYELVYLLALYLGLREGEVLGLQLDSIHLAHRTLRVDGALQWQKGKQVRTTPKTETSRRLLPLPGSLVARVEAHMEAQRRTYPESNWLFTDAKGGPLSSYALVRQFKRHLRNAGIRPIRFHDLRHSCATFLIERGEHPRTVMDILGHSQIATTMNIYGHIFDETKVGAVNGLDDFLGVGGQNDGQSAGNPVGQLPKRLVSGDADGPDRAGDADRRHGVPHRRPVKPG